MSLETGRIGKDFVMNYEHMIYANELLVNPGQSIVQFFLYWQILSRDHQAGDRFGLWALLLALWESYHRQLITPTNKL